MDLSQITPQQREFIESLSCEIEIEKHECLTWGLLLWTEGKRSPDAAFLDVVGKAVLIPVPQERIPNIRLRRVLLDGDVLIVFLQDTTFIDETRGGGYMVFSRRVPGADWHIATMYRQKFLSPEE